MSAKKIAETIAFELIAEYGPDEKISDDRIEKECYLAVAELKGDIKSELIEQLKGAGYEVED